MSKSNPTTRPDAPNYEVVGNMIHRYEPMDISEAFGVLSESKAPLCGFRDGDFQPWQQHCLDYVLPRAAEPFRAYDSTYRETIKFQQCARITAENPRKVPEGVPELPEPWLAYVPVDAVENYECKLLYGCIDGEWSQFSYSLTNHYAVDVRTAFARVHFPEYVQALGYPMEEPVPEVRRVTAEDIDRANSAKNFLEWLDDYANSKNKWARIARDAFDAGREYERKVAK